VVFCGLNGVVFSIADCYPKGAGFNSRVMLGIFPLGKRGKDLLNQVVAPVFALQNKKFKPPVNINGFDVVRLIEVALYLKDYLLNLHFLGVCHMDYIARITI
jgi:hypothetical protein